MEYQEFKRMITERLQAMLGDAVEVDIDTYYKNNETKIESLVFKEKTPANPIAVSPAVNLKDLYELFQKSGEGKEFEDCLSLIKRLYEEQEPKTVKVVRDDWDRTKDRVFMTLVNKAWNEELISSRGLIYKEVLDLVIIPRILVQKISPDMIGTMVVAKEMLSLWGIDEETLWQTAEYNLHQEIFGIKSMEEATLEALKEIGCKNDVFRHSGNQDAGFLIPDEIAKTQYIMSNRDRNFGAAAMLRTDLLQEFAEEKDSSFFILPSSIHEILLILDNGRYTVDALQDMVISVNETEVENIDRLSNNVYYFKKGSNSVQIAE